MNATAGAAKEMTGGLGKRRASRGGLRAGQGLRTVFFAVAGLSLFAAFPLAYPAIAAEATPAAAGSAATPADTPKAADAPKAAEAPAAADPVLGFRSALFGMTQAEVRKAIQKDFGVAPDAIKSELNRAEKTHVLTAAVADALPGGGRSEVAYVFGYKTDKLIQIGVTWSKATDPSITPDTLYGDAQQLQEYFLQAGYAPGSIATNFPVANGVVMFRGADADGRETVLLLEGPVKRAGDAKRALTPTSLSLIYKVDPKALDIYRLPKGDF